MITYLKIMLFLEKEKVDKFKYAIINYFVCNLYGQKGVYLKISQFLAYFGPFGHYVFIQQW